MVSYESEREAIGNEYGVIVPFLVSVYKGETIIEAYDGAEEQVTRILSHCNGSYFSKPSIDYIDSLLEPYVNSLGYYRETAGKYKWYEVYGAESLSQLDLTNVNDLTCFLSKEHLSLVNLTEFDLSELLSLPYPASVVIDNEKIVSLSCVNPCENTQKVLELTVATSPECRRRGYGLSATLMLAERLINDGYFVNYVCSRYNRASLKLAKKCNFAKMGRIYAYTAYAD